MEAVANSSREVSMKVKKIIRKWAAPVLCGFILFLGDNPAESFDSRYWGDPFIHEDDILARLFIQ